LGEEPDYKNDLDTINGTIYETYLKNIEPVKNYITTIRADSKEAHKQFENESLDFVFIDGDHSYLGCKSDLKNWFPKIKKNGIIAGHDYNEPTCGVKKAVDEFFLIGNHSYAGGCWLHIK
jgi:hypothetical protein